jgi:3-methyladenine DNA glycosylase AlkC
MPDNFFEKIYHDPAMFISALSSIGTLFTAFIAYRAIMATKKQREASYRPDLYLETSTARLLSPDYPFGSVRFLQEKRIEPTDGHKVAGDPEVPYDTSRFVAPQRWMISHLFNIGLGAAKAVEYYWEFDFEDAVEVLKYFRKDSSLELSDERTGDEIKTVLHLEDKRSGYNQYIVDLELDNKSSTDFIRPNSTPLISTQVTVSSAYLTILVALLMYKYPFVDEGYAEHIDDTFDELPSLYLNIAYDDIHNKRHTKRILVGFRFYNTASKGNPTPPFRHSKNHEFGTLFTKIKEEN